MIVPYASDAPLYHRPWATIGLIIANVVLFFAVDPASPDSASIWIMHHGSFAPWQWIPSSFTHLSLVHLLGNMIFLWSFGLIVEGKLGWRVFLPLYAGLAAAGGFIEQVLMLGGGPGSAGASGVIYSLMVMALLWAPHNRMDCLLVLFIRPYHFEMSVLAVCGFHVGWDLIAAMFSAFSMGSSLLHLIGAAVGLVPAVIMLRKGWVDCEGWDLLTLRAKRRERTAQATEHRPPPVPAWRPGAAMTATTGSVPGPTADATRPDADAGHPRSFLPGHGAGESSAQQGASVDAALDAGDLDAALTAYRRGTTAGRAIETAVHRQLINELMAGRHFDDALPVIRDWIKLHGEDTSVRVQEATILIRHCEMPAAGMKRLERLNDTLLPPEQRSDKEALATEARGMLDAGVLELAED